MISNRTPYIHSFYFFLFQLSFKVREKKKLEANVHSLFISYKRYLGLNWIGDLELSKLSGNCLTDVRSIQYCLIPLPHMLSSSL